VSVLLKSISGCPALHFRHVGVMVVRSIFTLGSSEIANDVKNCASALMNAVLLKIGKASSGMSILREGK
jgi:hypothetical protein